jgi:GT2 family glycosyltransferase
VTKRVAETMPVSIIIPTFNGAFRIGTCLDALLKHGARADMQILVVNDGSTDNTPDVVAHYSGVSLINQENAGPAAARNRGANEANGSLILFTDDDCVPTADWLSSMISAFDDPEVCGIKGAYRTAQKSLVARFVQIEYEDRYRLMARLDSVDFIDTYSAGFRRDHFLEMNGYDTSFPVACAEDVELSYRMSARGWKMKFVPTAVVYHTHPDTLWCYLKKKYKFAFWRVLAVRKNPSKAVKDSHTPRLMKLQLFFAPALLFAAGLDLALRPAVPVCVCVIGAFLVSALPFTVRAALKDPVVGPLCPPLLALRACAQIMGVLAGLIRAFRKPIEVPANSPA